MINDYITVKHPRVGDIVDMGESEYFGTVYTLSAIPSDMKSQLWDMGIVWEEISDLEFFYLLSRTLSVDRTRVFFGDLDLKEFELATNTQNDQLVMYKETEDDVIIIDEYVYMRIVSMIRKIHGIVPKVEKASTKTVQKILIEEDRRKISQKVKDGPSGSQLVPMISSLINCSEFKYDLEGIRKLPVYTFMDSVKRIQAIKSATALLQGCYGGLLDTSKINKKDLNWMRRLDD